ncbi:MAG: VOC family protein [Granulosicoccus sp.]
MKQQLALATLVVNRYDEAIDFFVSKLGFKLIEDTPLSPGNKRWVIVAPTGPAASALLLAEAGDENQRAAVGCQTGGRVAFFLHTDDFWRDYSNYKDKGVNFLEEPRKEPYGTVAVFEDICGNKWDLLQRK